MIGDVIDLPTNKKEGQDCEHPQLSIEGGGTAAGSRIGCASQAASQLVALSAGGEEEAAIRFQVREVVGGRRLRSGKKNTLPICNQTN